ncbi:MAG: Fe-S metabolism protein SufE [Marinilabiliales bacterium]|nr:MAG: Fe-S metabolism protein SufE [Marinilabiliales bacterium]
MEKPSIEVRQKEIISDLNEFEDWNSKYEYIIEFSDRLKLIEKKDLVVENLIEGCQSNVWIKSNFVNGFVFYVGDSDADIPKGILSMITYVVNGCSPDEIINAELFFLHESKLLYHLTPTRVNGLNSMIERIKKIAFDCKIK